MQRSLWKKGVLVALVFMLAMLLGQNHVAMIHAAESCQQVDVRVQPLLGEAYSQCVSVPGQFEVPPFSTAFAANSTAEILHVEANGLDTGVILPGQIAPIVSGLNPFPTHVDISSN